jgi:hypothetical protein
MQSLVAIVASAAIFLGLVLVQEALRSSGRETRDPRFIRTSRTAAPLHAASSGQKDNRSRVFDVVNNPRSEHETGQRRRRRRTSCTRALVHTGEHQLHRRLVGVGFS